MSDSSQTAAWPIICGVLAILCCAATTADVILYFKYRGSDLMVDAWKRRWNDDTKFFAEEFKLSAQKIADESYGRVMAEREIAVLQVRIADLERQMNAASVLILPTP